MIRKLLLLSLLLVLSVCVVVFLVGSDRGTASSPDSGKDNQRKDGKLNPLVAGPDSPAIRRTRLESDPADDVLASIEVRVLEEESQRPVPGATVWFVKPGFVYTDLDDEQRDRYSRSTESFLREFGLSRTTDGSGSTHIPIEAARNVMVVMVARKGKLHGKGMIREGVGVITLLVSVHHTLIVETVDTFGKAVANVKVMCQPVWSGVPDPMTQWSLGATDRNGRVIHVLKPPSAPGPEQCWLFAELLGGNHGREVFDPRSPPTDPIRLTIPATGTVHAKIRNPNGAALDREVLRGLHAVITVGTPTPTSKRYLVPLDAQGNARFDHVVYGSRLSLRFPPLLDNAKVLRGPHKDEPVITVEHHIEPDHPIAVGTLNDVNGNPIGNAAFTIFCRSNTELLGALGGKTDESGRFVAYLSNRAAGHISVNLSLGMGWVGLGPTREVLVPVKGVLLGKIDLGRVVMPNKK